MVWVGRGPWRPPAPIPGHGLGHLSLPQAAQRASQPSAEQFQWCGIHDFSGQPAPVSHHPHREKFILYIDSKPTLLQLITIAPCPTVTGPGRKSFSTFHVTALETLKCCSNVPPEPSPSLTEDPQLSQPLPTRELFHPSAHFCSLSLDPRGLYPL